MNVQSFAYGPAVNVRYGHFQCGFLKTSSNSTVLYRFFEYCTHGHFVWTPGPLLVTTRLRNGTVPTDTSLEVISSRNRPEMFACGS